MRLPMKARPSVSLKTLLVVMGVALISACAGSPTAPSAAPKVEGRSSGLVPTGRSNFTGYVVAERDSITPGMPMIQGLGRKLPTDTLSLSW